MRSASLVSCLVLCVVTASATPAFADDPADDKGVDEQLDDDSDADAGTIIGPAKVDLAGQATLALPATHVFIPKDRANDLLEAMGNRPGDDLVGIIAPKEESDDDYFISVRWEAEGYVKDDEADELDVDEMLNAFKEGAEESNEFRKERGFKPIHIEGWGQEPKYDKALHHIAWGLIVADEDGASVNYNTRLLGREGYLSLNLVCAPGKLDSLKPMLGGLLGETTYVDGKRYADFKDGQDKVSEYGLAALVMGGAAVGAKTFLKVGLLAKFGKVIIAALIAGKKAILLGLIAVAAFFKKIFGGKDKDPPSAPPAASPPQDPPTTLS